MLVTKENIKLYIPQGPPFVMIDEILQSDEKVTSTGLLITKENIFVENSEFKEPGLIENIAQTAAARSGYNSSKENKPVPIGYIGAIKNLQIKMLPKVGDRLITEVVIENQIFDVTVIAGKIICNEKLIAQCEMKIFINNNVSSLKGFK